MRTLSYALLALLALTGCARRGPVGWQGYIEGEFVYVALLIALFVAIAMTIGIKRYRQTLD